MTAWADAMRAIARRDAILYTSYRGQLVTQLVSPFFVIAIFYYISHLLIRTSFHSPGGYFGYVIVGLIIVQVLTISLGAAPTSVRQELVAGTIERFIVSAHGPLWSIVGMMIFPMFNAFITAIIMLTWASLIFGLPVVATAPLALPVAILGAFAFMPFALLLTAAMIAVKQTASASQFIVSGIAIIGGLYFPIALLPGAVRWMSDVQPFTPTAELVRHLIVNAPLVHSALLDLAKLAAFAAVLLPICVLVLRTAIRYGQRTGTIVEY